jgi:hypothetical protein
MEVATFMSAALLKLGSAAQKTTIYNHNAVKT